MLKKQKKEQAAPLPPTKRASRVGDRMLVATGLALATASALFPWYVFLNQDKFGIRMGEIGHTRDLPPGTPREVFSVSPLAMVDSTPDEKILPPEPMDSLTTATVSALGEELRNGQVREAQPFPGKSSFRLLHVANGRALIEDETGMYMVRVGSVLPDNSKLAALEQRDGRWVIVTSAGEVYQDRETALP
jgi:hypothetical protein